MGQDSTPICAQCKQKGHYRLECPVSRRIVKEIELESDQQRTQKEETVMPPTEPEEQTRDIDTLLPEKNGTCLSQDGWNIVQPKGSTA